VRKSFLFSTGVECASPCLERQPRQGVVQESAFGLNFERWEKYIRSWQVLSGRGSCNRVHCSKQEYIDLCRPHRL
jgi:hypothetical protein